MGQELSEDVVDQDIAMEDVLDNLDQDRAAMEIDPYGRAVKGDAFRAVTKKFTEAPLDRTGAIAPSGSCWKNSVDFPFGGRFAIGLFPGKDENNTSPFASITA